MSEQLQLIIAFGLGILLGQIFVDDNLKTENKLIYENFKLVNGNLLKEIQKLKELGLDEGESDEIK